jgi:hypothetical protein
MFTFSIPPLVHNASSPCLTHPRRSQRLPSNRLSHLLGIVTQFYNNSLRSTIRNTSRSIRTATCTLGDIGSRSLTRSARTFVRKYQHSISRRIRCEISALFIIAMTCDTHVLGGGLGVGETTGSREAFEFGASPQRALGQDSKPPSWTP